MTTDIELVSVRMCRPNLDAVPNHPVPPGYAFRFFRDGDRETWLDIWRASDMYREATDKTFDNAFGDNLQAMPRRCLFLVAPDGSDIGTAAAWYIRSGGLRWGRLHFVAVRPEYQKRGLSKPLVAAALNRMRSIGHRRAMLSTETPRIAAIRTYLMFGFQPDINNDGDRRAWEIVKNNIGLGMEHGGRGHRLLADSLTATGETR